MLRSGPRKKPLDIHRSIDGDGIRVGAKNGSSSSRYLWDRVSGLPALVDDGSQGYLDTNGLVEQLSSGGASAATYGLGDALGSVRQLTGSTGSAVASTGYDVFGSRRSPSGTQSTFGFTGQQTDPSGLVFLRARYYDPALGRFISPDSVQPNAPGTQGFDLYSYVGNDPTTATDPSGHIFGENVATYRNASIAAIGLQVAGLGLAIYLGYALGQFLVAEAPPAAEPVGQAVSKAIDDVVTQKKPEPSGSKHPRNAVQDPFPART